MTEFTAGVEGATGVMTTILGFITGSPILMVFFVASFIGVAVGLIRKFKR